MLRPGVPAQGSVAFVSAWSRGAGLVIYHEGCAMRGVICGVRSSWRQNTNGGRCRQGPRLGVLLVSVTELGAQPRLRLFPDASASEDVDGSPATGDVEQREEPDGCRQCRFHDEVFAQRL